MTNTTAAPLSAEQLDKLTRWTFDGGMTAAVSKDGQWLRYADVAALIAQARAAQPAQQPSKTEIAEAVRAAMKRAYNLGQTYWQQADSEYISQYKKAEVTAGRFIELTDDICSKLAAQAHHAAATTDDARQLAELILADPDGGYMKISSDLEHCTDGAMRFTVTNPETGRRFGVYLGLAELRAAPNAIQNNEGSTNV